mgnify:CR=1 FL=1
MMSDLIARKESYTPGYTDNAVQFMLRRTAARDAWFLLPHLRPGMDLLDLGCGPGTITVDLAKAVSPGWTMGVDIEPGQLQSAEQLGTRRAIQSLRFQQASIYDLPFPSRSFDVVFAHALFEHLGDPLEALDQVRRVLRPGGLVALCSPDWGGNLVAPLPPDVAQAVDFYQSLQRRNGGQPTIGRALGQLLQATGFVDVKLAPFYESYEPVSTITEFIAQRLEQETGLGASLGTMVQALRDWARTPGAFYAQSWVSAMARVRRERYAGRYEG